MELFNVLSGPLIGAVIGYVTNYIAVKMLFFPRNPVEIGGHRLPFTPGLIPRRKAALAGAIGRAVQEELFGEQEVVQILLAEDTRTIITQGIDQQIQMAVSSDKPLRQWMLEFQDSQSYEQKKEHLVEELTDKLVHGVQEMNVGQLIVEKGSDIVMNKLNNPLISMFLTPDLLHTIGSTIGDQVDDYVETEGREPISRQVRQEVDALEERTLPGLLEDTGLSLDGISEKLDQAYCALVKDHAKQLVGQFRIQEIIEERINAMSNQKLEELVLSVMKNELGMIVNLGAGIGFILGILNIFL